MIIAVSDLHLGYEKADKEDFLNFLDGYNPGEISRLVLVGDIFDFWREDNINIIKNNKEILSKISSLNIQEVNYIIGNHDYYLYSLAQRYGIQDGDQYFYGPFVVSKSLRLEDGGENFYFIHGYELEVFSFSEVMSIDIYETFSKNMGLSGDLSGKASSELWDVIQAGTSISGKVKDLLEKVPEILLKHPSSSQRNVEKLWDMANSKAARCMYLGMDPEEKLIFGHTHKPCISNDVVNTGAWMDGKNSYLEILDGKMALKNFPGDAEISSCPPTE